MKKIRDCKNFGELYEAIGERTFGNVAFVLTLMLLCAPFVAGIINRKMLHEFYYYGIEYTAYGYNYKCMIIWNVIFTFMILWCLIFILGKQKVNNWGIKGFLMAIKKEQTWLLWWLALLIWTIIPVACSVDPLGAILGIAQLAGGYISHYYMLGVMGCVYLISDKKQKERVVWAFIIVTDILSVIMLEFEYDFAFLGGFSAAPGVSVYTNSNHYGYIITMSYMAITGMYYFSLWEEDKKKRLLKKSICMVSLVVQAFAMMVNDTLGSYLAIMFAVIIMPIMWTIKTRKFRFEYLMPCIVMVVFTVVSYMGLIYTKLGSSIGPSLVVFIEDLFKVSQKSEGYEHAGTDRIGLWIETIKKIMERPIVGYGPDIVFDKNYKFIISNTPHNEFLECAFFMGIPGLVLYLGGLIHLCVIQIKKFKILSSYSLITAGVIIGYLASSFFGVRKFNTVCYFFMFIGLLIGKEDKKNYTNEFKDIIS